MARRKKPKRERVEDVLRDRLADRVATVADEAERLYRSLSDDPNPPREVYANFRLHKASWLELSELLDELRAGASS